MTQDDAMHRLTVVRRNDCAQGVAAVAAVRAVADELGLTVVVDEVLVRTESEARGHRCVGSPTVLINGQDIEPAARRSTFFGVT